MPGKTYLTPSEIEGGENEATEAVNLGLFDEPEPKPKSEKSKTTPKSVKKMSTLMQSAPGMTSDNERLRRAATENYAKGGKVKASKNRGDGCCVKGKTKGRMI